jgi:hypothetical protein
MITEITTTRRRDVITSQACKALGMSLICRRPNRDAKPPFEGVLLSWRLDHETALKDIQGRNLILPLTRATQRRKAKRLSYKASLAVMPRNQNRIHDGQEWTYLGRSLSTSQSGQELTQWTN